MSEFGLGKRLDLDIVVGMISEKDLTLKVSARGAQVILSFFNKAAGRGFEVGFSRKMVGELRELLTEAERRCGGSYGRG